MAGSIRKMIIILVFLQRENLSLIILLCPIMILSTVYLFVPCTDYVYDNDLLQFVGDKSKIPDHSALKHSWLD